jgi:hypothetical protein
MPKPYLYREIRSKTSQAALIKTLTYSQNLVGKGPNLGSKRASASRVRLNRIQLILEP